MISPLTSTTNVKIADEFDSDLIVKLYREGLQIDVSAYFETVQKVSLCECLDSGYRFYYPLSLEGKSDFYEKLSTSPIRYYLDWKWEYEVALSHIQANAKIVDVGCGDGTFLSLLKQRIPVECHGIEFNPDAIRRAKEKGITIHAKPLAEVTTLDNEGFDVATTFQVLEHIGNVKKFLSEKIGLVKNGGLIIIGVPYNNPYLYRKDKFHVLNLPPHHMGLWNEVSLKNLENYFPLKVEKIYIEPLDDLTYYLFVQMNQLKLYRKFSRFKVFRALSRINNSIFGFVRKRIRGRNVVAVYKKIK